MFQISKAIKLCIDIHLHQIDKCGKPYWLHPLNVFRKIKKYDVSKDAKIMALLHDTIEDSDLTFDDLRKSKFSENVINGLKLLTKGKNEDYVSYIRRIVQSGNKEVILVKYLDMMHNISYYRIRHLSYKTQKKMIRKYSVGLRIIVGGIENFDFKSKHKNLEI